MKILSYLRQLAGAIGALLRANKSWAPRPANIAVLYDDVASIVPLFGDEPFAVVELDGKRIYVDPRILLGTLRHAIATRRLTWRHLIAAYALAVLERIRPAIVVTFIESSVLHEVCRRFRAGRVLLVQNGMRMLSRDFPRDRSPQIYLREFACFGRHEPEEYAAHGAVVERYYPIGGIKDAYYRAHRGTRVPAKAFDLCIPSQFKPSARVVHRERLDSFEILVGHIRRFCDAHGATVAIALRRHPDTFPDEYEWEREFFRTRLGEGVQMFPNVPGAYSTYDLVDRSRVSIGMHTSVLREGFGRGNRILSCNYSGNPVYTFPIPGPWRLTDSAYEPFERQLLWLLRAPDDEYAAVCRDWPSYLMAYDEKTPTHVFLRTLIADAVRGVPEPAPARELVSV